MIGIRHIKIIRHPIKVKTQSLGYGSDKPLRNVSNASLISSSVDMECSGRGGSSSSSRIADVRDSDLDAIFAEHAK
jgi:hypothetical protein